MELRDYMRMLRRGWPAVVLITALFVGLTALYLAVTPKRYESTTVLIVAAADPRTLDDLQQASQFSGDAVTTYAQIIQSATVLGPVATELRLGIGVEELLTMVTASVPKDTTLINITAAADDPQRAAALANSIAVNATKILPALDSAAPGRLLIRVQQIQPAVEPAAATSPSVKRILALGFVMGVCIGLGVAIARQALDTRLRRVDDVRELIDVPMLAVLPHLKRSHRQGLVARDEPTGTAGEAYRVLRTNLRFVESAERRSLVFTAVIGDHDGAQVPVNLAWSLATAGRRVLLVDLDLRQSTVGEALGIRSDAGLSDVLTGQVELGRVVRQTKLPHLHGVLSGTAQPSPSDLLSTPALNQVLRHMERDYDYVILHAPPLLSYTDAAVVSGVAAGTVVTVAAGRTRAQDLETALSALANVRVRPLGVVLSGARRADGPGKAPRGEQRRPAAVAAIESPTSRHNHVAASPRPTSNGRAAPPMPDRRKPLPRPQKHPSPS